MTRHLTLDEMVEQFKTHFRGALQMLADSLEISKAEVMGFDFDPVEEDDGRVLLYATRPTDGRKWLYENSMGWQEIGESSSIH